MTFAEPQYAWLLFVLPVIALLKIFADSRAQRAMEAFASSERLRKSLLGGAAPVWSGLHFGLQLLGMAFLIIALTRPQYGTIEQEVKESGRNIFIAIDTSKSMLAEDVKPNRLTRAKLAAQDLLEKLPGDRVGLIAFAGRAFLQAPLTTDHDAVIESIQSLDHTTIPRGGSSVAAAIKLALEATEKAAPTHNGMILFTDGQETDAATLEAAQVAKERNFLILPVGVGTTEGDVIPDPEGNNPSGYVTDNSGNIVHSRLESGMLREVAKITGGEYVGLSSQALTQSLVARLTANLETHEAGSRQESRQAERYQWPLLAGILCMAMSLFMRPSSRKRVKVRSVLPVDPQAAVHVPASGAVRGHGMRAVSAAVGVVAWFLLSGQGVEAAVDERVQKAQEDYRQGNYKEAQNGLADLLADDESRVPKDEVAYGLGAAQMMLGEEDKAVRAFSRALQSKRGDLQVRSLRALGNVLYEKGKKERDVAAKMLQERKQAQADEAISRTIKDWEDALAHLGTALQREPEHKPTHENYDFVKDQLEKLKKQAEEEKQKREQEKKEKGEKGDQQEKGDGKGEGEGEGGEGKDQPQGQGEGNEERESKEQDAMQEGDQEVPDGQVSAGESGGDPNQQPGQKEGRAQEGEMADSKRNEATGFSPQEARSQLRSYADDQNSVQYLMRRERPEGGKDY